MVQALIFVIDSNDKDRLIEARDELQQLLKNSELSNAKLLVFANKQDMAKVLTAKEITDWLYLNRLKGRDWHVQPCSATTGEGLREGLDWLANALKDNKKSSKTTTTTKTNGVSSPQTPRTTR
jgi:ADP-ribosylation factor protein 1